MTQVAHQYADDIEIITADETSPRAGRWRLWVMMAIGLGLALAPAAFQMFSRAPKGGTMINEFRPFMTESRHWPTISSEFAQFLGAMSDNVDNFAAVKALPPFALFPFFFIVPGLLVAGLAFTSRRIS
jgi:hypothetical protein